MWGRQQWQVVPGGCLFQFMVMDFRKISLCAGVSLLAVALAGCGGQKSAPQGGSGSVKTLTSQDLMIIGDKVLKDTYQKFDVKRRCWVTENADNVSFCMKQASINVVTDNNGQTIYLLATGGVLRRQDNAPGIAGMFVVKPENSGYRVLAQSTHTVTGFASSVPEGRFLQLGPSVGGWVFTSPEIVGNPDRAWHLFGLGKDAVQDLGMLKFHYRRGMFALPRHAEINLDADASEAKGAYYPLNVTIGNTRAGKVSALKKYVLTFDAEAGQYVPPKDWPAERKTIESSAQSGQSSSSSQPSQPVVASEPAGQKAAEAKPVEIKKTVPKPVEQKKVPEPDKKAENGVGK